jgi:C4-dicarboxylate transporter DctM subunit
VATTAAIGGIMYPEMTKKNYPGDYTAAVQAIGGTLGIVIPPSIVVVIYGNITGTSVSRLLMAGVIPGLIAGIALSIYAYIHAIKNGMPIDQAFSITVFFRSLGSALWALIMPFIILGGIYLGVFTPTEAAAVAVFYGLIVCFFVYREITGKTTWEIIKATAVSTSALMFLVVSAQVFGYLIAFYRIPVYVTELFIGIAHSGHIFLLLVIMLLLICGMFLDVSATNLILSPILAPIAVVFKIDPIHFGMLFVFLLALGQATPPFGTTMFVACSLSKQPVSKVAKQLIPFVCVEILCAFVFAFVPALSTFLPNIMNN